MAIFAILIASVVLQLVAAVMALRLIRITGGRIAWLLIAIALTLMALRRAFTLYQLTSGFPDQTTDLVAELVGLIVAVILVAAMAWIGPLFISSAQLSDELLESESRHRMLFESAHDAILLMEEDQVIDCNVRALIMFGCEREQILGLPPLRLSPPSQPEGFKSKEEIQKKSQAAMNGEAQFFEWQYRRMDGSLFDAEVSLNRFDVGEKFYLHAIVRDITERKSAEWELSRLQEFNEKIIQTMAEGLAVEDKDGYFTFVNPAGAAMLGYSPAQIMGRHWTVTVPPDQQVVVKAADERRERGISDRYELTLVRKDGTRFPVLVSGSPLFENGDFVGTMALLMDISARKLREREHEAIIAVSSALRTAAGRKEIVPLILEQMLELLEAEGVALAVRDPETDETLIELGDGAWKEKTGARFPPGVGAAGRAMQTGRSYVNNELSESPESIRNGMLSNHDAILVVPLMAHKETIGALLLGRDPAFSEEEVRILTAIGDMAANALRRVSLMETLEHRVDERTWELANANERLKELDRLKSDFVSNVSHELRTPITNILLYLDLLGQPISDEKHEVYISVLLNQSRRLSQLIEDLLTLSRLDEKTIEPAVEPYVLDAIIAEVIAAHQARAKAKNVALNHNPNPEVPAVAVNKDQMTQVFTNLVHNAVAYTHPEGKVIITSEIANSRDQSFIAIRVHNDGPKIPPDDLPHLFERFYRGQTARESGEPGSGLGLAICKEIIEQQGGWIEVESSKKKGTVFTIWTPCNSSGT